MTDLVKEFEKFLKQENEEELNDHERFLINKLNQARSIISRVRPFIQTWHDQAHGGTGSGAKQLIIEIDEFSGSLKKKEF